MSSSETTGTTRFVQLPWGRAQVIDEVSFESPGADGQPVSVGVAHLREPDGIRARALLLSLERPHGARTADAAGRRPGRAQGRARGLAQAAQARARAGRVTRRHSGDGAGSRPVL